MDPRVCSPISLSRPGLTLPFSREVLFFINSSRARRQSLLILEIHFPMLLFLCLFKATRNGKRSRSVRNILTAFLTYFHLPTLAVYLCSAVVEHPLLVMVYCILVVPYDRCAIHRSFPMTSLLSIAV